MNKRILTAIIGGTLAFNANGREVENKLISQKFLGYVETIEDINQNKNKKTNSKEARMARKLAKLIIKTEEKNNNEGTILKYQYYDSKGNTSDMKKKDLLKNTQWINSIVDIGAERFNIFLTNRDEKTQYQFNFRSSNWYRFPTGEKIIKKKINGVDSLSFIYSSDTENYLCEDIGLEGNFEKKVNLSSKNREDCSKNLEKILEFYKS